LPSEGEVLLPAQPLSEHIATLGAAMEAPDADSRPHLKSQFGATRHAGTERSLGEISNGQVEQPLQDDGASCRQEMEEIPPSGIIADQLQTRPVLVQETVADNGLSSGKHCFKKQGAMSQSFVALPNLCLIVCSKYVIYRQRSYSS